MARTLRTVLFTQSDGCRQSTQNKKNLQEMTNAFKKILQCSSKVEDYTFG